MALNIEAKEYYPPGLRPRAQPRLLPAGPELIEMARVAMRGNVPTDTELSRMSRIALESGPSKPAERPYFYLFSQQDSARPTGRASRKRKRRSRSKSHKKRHKRKEPGIVEKDVKRRQETENAVKDS